MQVQEYSFIKEFHMNKKERIDCVLSGQKPDRTPFALVDGGAWVAYHNNMSYRDLYGSEDGGAAKIVEFANAIDTDLVSAVSGVFTACLNAFGCPINIDKIGFPVDTGAAFSDPETEIPKLDKSKVREMLLANEFVCNMLKQCRNVKALVKDEKYLIGDIAAPFTMASVMVGSQDFIMLLLDDPDLCQQLIDFTTQICIEMFRLLHENGCDIALPAEPVGSGSMISLDMFEEFAVPALKKVREALPEYKYFFTHVCGASGNRVAGLIEAGTQAFSCDYLVDLETAFREADGKLNFMGNVNPAGALLNGTPEDVYEEACRAIRISEGRGLILSPGCDLASAAPLENVQMLVKACKDLAF